MYFAVHILPPAQRQRNSENAIRTVPVPIEGDKTFADLLQSAQVRFEAVSSGKKTDLRFDTLADKHGAEMFASDKIESLFGSSTTGVELFLYTSEAFKVPPKPVRTPATTKGEPAFKRRRLAPPTPDSNAEVPSEEPVAEHAEPAEDPIEDFDDYELPASSAFDQLNGSQRKERTYSPASAARWRPEEDEIVAAGMKHGWSMKMVLAKLPGYDRTASAVRSRRKWLRENAERKKKRSPSKLKLVKEPPSSSEGQLWTEDELAKLRLGRAGGLDSRAIHERYFLNDRTHDAVEHKLRRMTDLNAIPSGSAPPASTQPESSPAEAARARRQSPAQVEMVTRTAYVQLPAREEVEAQMKQIESRAVAAPPHVRMPTQQEGIFGNQSESERWRICMARADGDEEKARRVREDMQNDMDMINAVAREDQNEIENIKARRIQIRLRRAVTDGRARRKNRRTPRSKTLVPSREAADEEVLRESDWEVLEDEDIAETNDDMMHFGDEEPGNDNDSEEHDLEDMIRDRKVEEVEDEEEEAEQEAEAEAEAEVEVEQKKKEEEKAERGGGEEEEEEEEEEEDDEDDEDESEDESKDEEVEAGANDSADERAAVNGTSKEEEDEEEEEEDDDDQARNDLALLETQLVESTPIKAEAPSSNAIPESEQSIDDSAMSVRTDESKSKVRPTESQELVKPDLEQRARRRSRGDTIAARAGAPRSRSRTNSVQSKSDAAPSESLADDKAPQTSTAASTPSTSSSKTPGKLPTLRRRMQVKPEEHTPARKSHTSAKKSKSSDYKSRPSDYDVPTHEKKARSSPPRLAATSAFVGTLSKEREQLLRNVHMPPPPKRRDPNADKPKRKANGDPIWFESDDAESSSSSDSD